jgi:hypothetical protein
VPDAKLYRTATAAALIVGPALLLMDNLIHPEELPRGNEAEQLAAIADAPARWQLAHLIGFLGIVAFAAAIAGLAYLVRQSRPRLGLAGGALGIAGLLALAFALALDGYTWGTIGEVYGRQGVDQATLATTLDELQNSAWSLPYYGLISLWVAGMLILALGSAPVLGWRPATLLGVGTILVAIEGLVADNAYFIASSAVFFAGGTYAAVAALRAGDRAWTRSA